MKAVPPGDALELTLPGDVIENHNKYADKTEHFIDILTLKPSQNFMIPFPILQCLYSARQQQTDAVTIIHICGMTCLFYYHPLSPDLIFCVLSYVAYSDLGW